MPDSITEYVYAEVPKVLLVIELVGVGAIVVEATMTAYDIGMLQAGQRAFRHPPPAAHERVGEFVGDTCGHFAPRA